MESQEDEQGRGKGPRHIFNPKATKCLAPGASFTESPAQFTKYFLSWENALRNRARYLCSAAVGGSYAFYPQSSLGFLFYVCQVLR